MTLEISLKSSTLSRKHFDGLVQDIRRLGTATYDADEKVWTVTSPDLRSMEYDCLVRSGIATITEV